MSEATLLKSFDLVAEAPDGVARLRELILTLAVQGKLVPQDPNDEPASALLKKIRAERGRLIGAGKLKHDKPLAEIPEEERPFEIPNSWQWVPLGEVVEIVRGITFPANEKTKVAAPGRIACLRTANVQEQIEWDDLLFIAESFVGRPDQRLQVNDIVMSMANSRELVGKVALVKNIPHSQATFGGFLGVLRAWQLVPQFVMVLLRTAYARSALIDSASQTTNIANVSLGKLRPLPFPVPPLAEQRRIVARVDELMKLCDALEAKGRLADEQHNRLTTTLFDALANSESAHALAESWRLVAEHFDLLLDRPEVIDALEKTILQLAVRGLLVPQDPNDEPASELLKKIRAGKDRLIADGKIKRDKPLPPISEGEQPFVLPASWEWVRLSELMPEFQNGASSRGDAGGKLITVLRLADIKNRRISLADTRQIPIASADIKKYQIVKGDILITRVNGSADIVGQFNLSDRDFDAIYCDHFIRMRLNNGWISSEFCALLGESDLVRSAIKNLFITTAGQKTVNQAHIGSLTFGLPPLAEQTRIVVRVESLRRLCADLRQRLMTARSRQAQLAQALVEEQSAVKV